MDEAEKEIQEILKKHKVKYGYSMNFPQYNILPDEVKLAISVLIKNGMVIQFVLKPDIQKK